MQGKVVLSENIVLYFSVYWLILSRNLASDKLGLIQFLGPLVYKLVKDKRGIFNPFNRVRGVG